MMLTIKYEINDLNYDKQQTLKYTSQKRTVSLVDENYDKLLKDIRKNANKSNEKLKKHKSRKSWRKSWVRTLRRAEIMTITKSYNRIVLTVENFPQNQLTRCSLLNKLFEWVHEKGKSMANKRYNFDWYGFLDEYFEHGKI